MTSKTAGWSIFQLGRYTSAGRLRVPEINAGTSLRGAKLARHVHVRLNSARACGTRTRYACTVCTCDTHARPYAHAHTHIHLRTRTRTVQNARENQLWVGPGLVVARSVSVSVLNGPGLKGRPAHSAVFREV